MKIGRNEPCKCGSKKKYKACCLYKDNTANKTPAEIDWRCRATTTLNKPFKSPWTGTVHPIGTPVTQTSGLMMGGQSYNFLVPSPPALFLDLSKKAFLEAEKLKKKPSLFSTSLAETPFLETNALFDFLEYVMASVVFAYTAIETFANTEIPDEYTHKEVRQDKKCIEVYSKSQIERHLNLKKKLELLPEILKSRNIVSVKETKLWQRFTKLEALRDRIIHLKSVDLMTAKHDNPIPDTIWKELIELPETYTVALDLLMHYSGTDVPSWLRRFPKS